MILNKFLSKVFGKSPTKNTAEEKVACREHGLNSTVTYTTNGELFLKVCFKCWAFKQCEGLKNFVVPAEATVEAEKPVLDPGAPVKSPTYIEPPKQ